MARPSRVHRDGAFYHVMLRGNDGQRIFFSDADRCKLSLLIQEGIEKYGHRIHAFCFMTNHIHLLVQVGNVSLSKIVQNLAFRYSQWINKTHQRVGHLFQGRFKAVMLQEEAYFVRLLRYIHTNPLRAKLVKTHEQYAWSGHNVYLGSKKLIWLTTVTGLSKFAATKDEARIKYLAYVKKEESDKELEELRKRFKGGQALGEDKFVEEIRNAIEVTEKRTITIKELLEAASQTFEIEESIIASSSKSRLASLARATVALLAKEEGQFSLEEVAKFFNRDSSTISSLLERFRRKSAHDSGLNELIEKSRKIAHEIAELQV